MEVKYKMCGDQGYHGSNHEDVETEVYVYDDIDLGLNIGNIDGKIKPEGDHHQNQDVGIYKT